MASLAFNQLNLAPLGAGDLIDRAVRLYRRHFMTLIRISAPPVIISAIGSVLWAISMREFTTTSSGTSLALYFLLAAVGLLLLAGGLLLNVIVMGGATRNLVMHLLWNEPVSVRTTYRSVRARFWGLLGASILVSVFVGLASTLCLFVWFAMVMMFAALSGFIALAVPLWVSAIVGIVSTIAAIIGAGWLFFLIVGRFVYVPQVMLVEGKGVFAAVSRSAALASGNVRRLAAMTLFTTFATYSALMILLIPLGWYGYLNGIDPSPWSATNWPAWYAIGYNVLAQSSSILLTPIWMLGLSLLYVDERVRHEGYDIELMAARQLGEMPQLSAAHASPYAPAIVTHNAATASAPDPPPGQPAHFSSGSVLGLR